MRMCMCTCVCGAAFPTSVERAVSGEGASGEGHDAIGVDEEDGAPTRRACLHTNVCVCVCVLVCVCACMCV
jgi:hypothetical protein